MKKTTKFLFGFASTILMATGCQLAPVTPKKTAEEKVTEAQNLLVYSGLNGVTGNFELIQSVAGLEDVKITYTVSTPAVDYLAVEGTTMKVTRPKFTEGDKSFAPGFTATFTLDDVTKTKDFNVKILALPEENKELTLVTNPVKDTNYKIGFTNATETKFFNGEMSSFYGATASHPYYGVDVQLKETTGGYHLTFVDAKGKTQYIAVAVTTNEKGTHTNFVFAETPAADGAVWTYDADNNTVITTLGGERHWIGGAGTYTTFDMYNDAEKEEKDFYPAQFYTYTGGAPVVTDKPTAATSLSTEKEYNLGMEIAEQKMVYFTGSMADYYGASSETRSEGVVAKVETAENGYYLSFMKGSEKKYIGAEVSETHLNFKIHSSAQTVWSWDATYNTLTTTLGEEKVYIGTYGSYKTFGVSKYSTIESSYPAHFYEIGGTTDTPAATEPAPVETTIAALVANAPTEDAAQIYIVEGTWETKAGTAPADNKYGNGKLLDGENSVTIYGLCGSKSVLTYAEGKYTYKNAQDFLTLNVVDGTKVKVGMVYSTQYKNYSAYLIEITGTATPDNPGTDTPVTPEPEDPTPSEPTDPETPTIPESGSITIDFNTETTLVGDTAVAEEKTFTYEGITFGYKNIRASGYDGKSFIMLTKNVGATLYNKTAFPSGITSVEVTVPSGSSGAAVYYLDLFDELTDEAITSATTRTGAGTLSITANEADGKTFFNISNNPSIKDKNGQISKIVVNYGESSTNEPTEPDTPVTPEPEDPTPSEPTDPTPATTHTATLRADSTGYITSETTDYAANCGLDASLFSVKFEKNSCTNTNNGNAISRLNNGTLQLYGGDNNDGTSLVLTIKQPEGQTLTIVSIVVNCTSTKGYSVNDSAIITATGESTFDINSTTGFELQTRASSQSKFGDIKITYTLA